MDYIRIDKYDILWSYAAQFLQLASGLIILPIVLRILPAEELGLNYLMLNIGTLVALLDFGFAPQFGRNISYVYGGAQKLLKTGVSTNTGGKINYKLLATMIRVAKIVYRYLSIITLFVMLTLGTAYIYIVTEGFSTVQNSFLIWLVYCISVFFGIYFVYYESLLLGAGQIKESKIAIVSSKLCYIILSLVFLYSGLSLLGLCLANLISPFLYRYLCKRYYFTKELKNNINQFQISDSEIKELFFIIWYNAKKLGLNFLATYAISKMGLFLAGLFLSLEVVSSYGLLMQIVTLLGTVSMMLFTTIQPQLSAYRIEENNEMLIRKFSFSIVVFYFLYIVGSIIIIFIAPRFLEMIHSNSELPNVSIVVLYCIVMLLEYNHSTFATLILTSNKVPFVKPSILSGLAIIVCSFISLYWFHLGVIGLIISQGVCQLIYNNWKWPKMVLDEFHLNLPTFLGIGLRETILITKTLKPKRKGLS